MNITDPDGRTALMFAAESGHDASVDSLIQSGADVNFSDSDGATALLLAVQMGYDKCVDLLIKTGANVNVTLSDGKAAIYMCGFTNGIRSQSKCYRF